MPHEAVKTTEACFFFFWLGSNEQRLPAKHHWKPNYITLPPRWDWLWFNVTGKRKKGSIREAEDKHKLSADVFNVSPTKQTQIRLMWRKRGGKTAECSWAAEEIIKQRCMFSIVITAELLSLISPCLHIQQQREAEQSLVFRSTRAATCAAL